MAEDPRIHSAAGKIGKLVDGVIAQVCERHYLADTQEHQLTAKIAEALERELKRLSVQGLRLSLNLQDFPDKGRGSKERKAGADLYISIVMQSPGRRFSKGMLVQSKWDDTFSPRGKEAASVSRKMMERSASSSYFWVYGAYAIRAYRIAEMAPDGPHFAPGRTVGETIANGFRCMEGDEKIGRRLDLPLVPSLNAALKDIAARKALSFLLETEEKL
jgi:hypothetical protein